MSRTRASWGVLLLAAALTAAGLSTATAPARSAGATPTIPADPVGADPVPANVVSHQDRPSGHEGDEGLVLAPPGGESVGGDGGCPTGAAMRRYDVVAIDVDLTLNRYGDHDPEGRMYALASRVEAIRDAEAAGAEGVSLGLQGDVIQPLVLRVLPGECLAVHLTNSLDGEPASFHLHDSSLVVAGGGGAATAANPAATAAPGASVDYEWMVPADEPEGGRVFHSHALEREQTAHGLFGTVVVEPPGATWRDPRNGGGDTAGWDAVISAPGEPEFREFVLAYHEIGDENFHIVDADGGFVPQVDPLTFAYRPGSRALNYRSEPFYDRLALRSAGGTLADESLAYSSYSYGDPATPMERTYVGDRVKERVVHAGGEVFHVHHMHGGSVRWRRQPGAGPTGFGEALDKAPELLPGASERTDSQTIGPSESFDVEHECSAGGCQQSAGDYLVHCHIAHHYFAGMWGIWRVYNTLQNGASSTDSLPPLPALADRGDDVPAAVTSDALGADQLRRALDSLPPQGVPKGYDAAVWDWTTQEGRVVGEPETTEVWPGYRSAQPGVRPPVLFDPATGRPAYPMMRPHLAARPPFAPGHGPAASLDRPRPDGTPSPPGADGPESLCPTGTRLRSWSLRAVALPVPINERERITDTQGTLFVLAEDEAAMRADPARRQPLALRANATEDCIDVTLTNEIVDDGDHPFSKVSAHVHFMQFDPQAGDGVDVGFNFEQTVRPFQSAGEALVADAVPGQTRLALTGTERFTVGAYVGVGVEDGTQLEVRRISAVDGGGGLVLDRPLEHAHPAGAVVSSEFVRYRWYPDAQVGTAYFHDHVNGLRTWQHGLVGAVVVEPPGATYHDPATGEEITSGVLADIRVPGGTPVSADVDGSFREFVCFLQDPSQLTSVGRSPGANINLRAEPLGRRSGPVEEQFSSSTYGDPVTPMPRAYVGDPLVLRVTVGGTNEVHTLHVDGHWFREEPWSPDSPAIDTVHVGISERKDVSIPAAGGPQGQPGDYLYNNGRAVKLQEGAWGLLRVEAAPVDDLQPLPGRDPPRGPPPPVCPDGAPLRRYRVAAVDAPLPMLGGKRGAVFVVESDAEAVRAGSEPVNPMVLRAVVGDCLEITLVNSLAAGSDPVALHADGLAYDPATSGGVAAGRMPTQAVAVGDERTYTFFAHPEFGTGAKLLRDGADLAGGGARGLYGAVVVAPAGSTFDDDTATVTVVRSSGGEAYRDAVIFMHDEDDSIGTHRMPYTTEVRGAAALNYGTPLQVEAYAGDPLQVHVVAPWSEQAQVFNIEGHRWPLTPGMPGTTVVESLTIGGLESITAIPAGGAGGQAQLAGTFVLGNHRQPYREAGMTATLVVHPRCVAVERLAPLLDDDPACRPEVSPTDTESPSDTTSPVPPAASGSGASLGPWTVVLAAGIVAAVGFFAIRRRRHQST